MFTLQLTKSTKLLNIFRCWNRTKSSALYITGDKAQETYAFVTPHLDFEQRIENRSKLERNLQLRGIDTNLDELVRIWNFYKHVESKKTNLEESKSSITQTIKNLSKHGSKHAEKIETLKVHSKMVKEDLKVLRDSVADVEEKAALRILALPNVLHDKTPESDSILIHNYLEKSDGNLFHLNVAKQYDLVDYLNPSCYYLKNEAALFELATTFYLSDLLLSSNFNQFSNSDFTRSVIVEGCGIDYSDPTQVYTLNESDSANNKLHLTGSASITSFMAYFTKHTVYPTSFPLRYFATGRQYHPQIHQTHSLLNTTQETAMNIFVATKDWNEMETQFDQVIENVIKIYESFGYHFQICMLPVKELETWECLRASIRMFSPHLNDYVQIGYVSMCGDYFSKRLLFNYGQGFNVNFPCVITGTLLSVPKMLSCILENNDFSIDRLLTEQLKKYVV